MSDISSQWAHRTELENIIKICNILTETYDRLENLGGARVSVGLLFEDTHGDGKSFPVIDSNGETLGYVGIGEDGQFAFYFKQGYEA